MATKKTTTKTEAYLICGEDEFRVAFAAKQLVDRLVPENEREFGLEIIEGRVDNASECQRVLRAVRDALVSDGLFSSGNKTVWLRSPVFLTNERIGRAVLIKNDLQNLIDRVKEGLPEGQRLVVSTTKVNRTSAFFKAFKAVGEITDFGNNLRARQKNEAAAELLVEFLPRVGLEMAPAVRQLFLSRVGTDSRQIVSELEKLACYCGEGKNATADDVRAITCSGAVSEIWDFVDAFATRNHSALMKQIRIQLDQGENAIRMTNSLLTVVNDLLAIREGLDRKWAYPSGQGLSWNGLSEEVAQGLDEGEKDIRSAMGFRVRKLVDQASAWTLRDLRNARHFLLALREDLVSSSLPPDFLLETRLLQAVGYRRSAQRHRA